jgi:hypothetical protein
VENSFGSFPEVGSGDKVGGMEDRDFSTPQECHHCFILEWNKNGK